jgi:hypothetical protein
MEKNLIKKEKNGNVFLRNLKAKILSTEVIFHLKLIYLKEI